MKTFPVMVVEISYLCAAAGVHAKQKNIAAAMSFFLYNLFPACKQSSKDCIKKSNADHVALVFCGEGEIRTRG